MQRMERSDTGCDTGLCRVSIETAVCALSSVDILRLLTTLALSPFVNVMDSAVVEAVLDVEMTGGNRRKITKLMIKVKQRMMCALSSVDILRLLTTLALSPFVNVSSFRGCSTKLLLFRFILCFTFIINFVIFSMDTLQRHAST
jgi:hypothetical protein